MIRTISDKYGYKGVMAVLSVLTFISGFFTLAFGEILIPVSSALLAVLFIFESPKARILSYLIPSLSVVCACLFFGLYSLTGAQFIIFGVILAVCYRYGIKKAETSVYLTLAIFVFFLFTLYILGAKETGTFAFSNVTDYYKAVVSKLKDNIYEMLISENSAFTISPGNGNLADETAVREYVTGFVNVLPALFAVVAFALAGATVKLFVFIMLKISKHGILKSFAHFIPSSLVSYIYIVISIIAMFLSDGSLFSLALVNASQFLMFVFAYMGFQYVLALGAMSGRKGFFIGISIAAFILFPQGAVQILSYLGAWFCISFARGASAAK